LSEEVDVSVQRKFSVPFLSAENGNMPKFDLNLLFDIYVA